MQCALLSFPQHVAHLGNQTPMHQNMNVGGVTYSWQFDYIVTSTGQALGVHCCTCHEASFTDVLDVSLPVGLFVDTCSPVCLKAPQSDASPEPVWRFFGMDEVDQP